MASMQIGSFADCVSEEERNQRFSVTVVNSVLWFGLAAVVAASLGIMLLVFLLGWLSRLLLANYNVRRVQALGATVSDDQMPEVHKALTEVLARFGSKEIPRIVVIGAGEVNALAIKFARQRVVVLLSELLEGIIDNPAQLRFLLAHECCHHALDHGGRGIFELYKPARYRQAREMTCDNAGVVAANDAKEACVVISKLCVGNRLSSRLNQRALQREAATIYSGFSGWLLRRHLSHPPAGKRLANIERFADQKLVRGFG
jgi:Zn-dependent protease with chaperone function